MDMVRIIPKTGSSMPTLKPDLTPIVCLKARFLTGNQPISINSARRSSQISNLKYATSVQLAKGQLTKIICGVIKEVIKKTTTVPMMSVCNLFT